MKRDKQMTESEEHQLKRNLNNALKVDNVIGSEITRDCELRYIETCSIIFEKGSKMKEWNFDFNIN